MCGNFIAFGLKRKTMNHIIIFIQSLWKIAQKIQLAIFNPETWKEEGFAYVTNAVHALTKVWFPLIQLQMGLILVALIG